MTPTPPKIAQDAPEVAAATMCRPDYKNALYAILVRLRAIVVGKESLCRGLKAGCACRRRVFCAQR